MTEFKIIITGETRKAPDQIDRSMQVFLAQVWALALQSGLGINVPVQVYVPKRTGLTVETVTCTITGGEPDGQ